MSEEPRRVAAKCRVCGERLTVEEFRACEGVGHFCGKHLPAKQVGASSKPRRPSRTKKSTAVKGNRRGRRISESGATEYSCKAQFARDGVIRRGKLTSDHPSCLEGDVVFVSKDVGYGPSEIAMLYIADPEGRARAQTAGFECRA